jgi:hypothetical protein
MSKHILSIALGVLLTISLGLAGKILWDKYQLGELNNALSTKLMEANLEIGKAKTSFDNAKNYIDELEDELRDEIDKNGELLTMYGELEAEYEAFKEEVPVTETEIVYVEGPAIEVPVELNLKRGLLYQAITSKTITEIGEISATFQDHRIVLACLVSPRENNERKVPMSMSYFLKLRLRGQLLQTKSDTGSSVNHYLNLYELDDKGREVGKFKLTEFNVVTVDPSEKEFFWWVPRLDIGGNVGVDTNFDFHSSFSVGMSFMGYGAAKYDLNWRFARLGAELSGDAIGLSFAPVQWNMRDIIPFTSNLWLAPQGAIFSDGRKSLGLMLNVGL